MRTTIICDHIIWIGLMSIRSIKSFRRFNRNIFSRKFPEKFVEHKLWRRFFCVKSPITPTFSFRFSKMFKNPIGIFTEFIMTRMLDLKREFSLIVASHHSFRLAHRVIITMMNSWKTSVNFSTWVFQRVFSLIDRFWILWDWLPCHCEDFVLLKAQIFLNLWFY